MRQLFMYKCLHSFVIPYHSNFDLLKTSLSLLIKTLPADINKEIIIVANNVNPIESDITINMPDCRVISVHEDLLYAKAVNLGVENCTGDVVTLCDEDLFYINGWYEPLFNKLISSDTIGCVGSKLLNPSDNTILDFGIDFALYNNVHPSRGLPWNHPVTMDDRNVQALCSAILMTTPSIFKQVNGMDPCMAYVCCDCDFGIKLNQLGYENWLVASSIVYHKGPSSQNNTKNTRYSYLKCDARAMFYAKDYDLLQINLPYWFEKSCDIYKKTYEIQDRYILVNLCSYTSAEWFINIIEQCLNIKISATYKYNTYCRNLQQCQLYDYISLNLIDCVVPIIYFVDNVKNLRHNAIWKHLRNTQQDLAIDIDGNILNFYELDSLYSNIVPPIP